MRQLSFWKRSLKPLNQRAVVVGWNVVNDPARFALTGVGAVGLTATALQRSIGGQASMFAGSTNAPYFIFGGVALAGVATVTVSRILAVRKARQYDMILFPAPVPGGAGLALSIRFP